VTVKDNPDDSMEASVVVRKINDDANIHWRTKTVQDVDEWGR
jgi:hypothetical protein